MDRDPCPTCGKSRGYMMSTHDDMPGVMERLRGVNGQADRWVIAAMVCVLLALNLAAAHSIFHI